MRCALCRQDEQGHARDANGNLWCCAQPYHPARAVAGRVYTDGMRQGIGLENGKVGVLFGGIVLSADMGLAWAEVKK